MASPSLAELQEAMTARILGDEGPSPLDDWIRVPGGADLEARLSVYQEGYPARIASSLSEAFPAIANILGDGSLAKLTERFIRRGLPSERNLNRIGRSLPHFLVDDPLSGDLPFLPDLAALEWAIFECFHSEPGRDFDLATTTAFSLDDWARTQITFRPGSTVVLSAWPIRELWMTRELDRSEINLDLAGRPEQVLVHRVGFAVETQSIDALEALALERLLDGARLGEVMQKLSEEGAEPERVSSLFTRWVTLGLIGDCRPT
jgi:hypothetical protein